MTRSISLVSVPSKPRTRTDEELAAACGVALADQSLIDFAEYGSGSTPAWMKDALSGDLTKNRNAAVKAVHEVYGAHLEQLRREFLDDVFVEQLSEHNQRAIRELEGFNRDDRPALAHALWGLGKLQRQELQQRRVRLMQVRDHALQREARMRSHRPRRAVHA